MENYIGVKILKAEPMSLGDYNAHKCWTSPENEDPDRPGYLVEYPDGYQSWSPKEIFEGAYLPMGNDPSKVSLEMVNLFMGEVDATQWDEKTTMVTAETITGFRQIEVSACVDPQNFDMEIGKGICVERIRDSLWKCLGFVVQWGRFGLNKKNQ